MSQPWEMTFDVGLGDFVNADSFLSPERRAALTTIHHSFLRGELAKALIEATAACPSLRHVVHKGLEYPTKPVPGAITCLRDHAISHRLTYFGSAFLDAPLEVEPLEGLPDRFVFLQPSTPKNGPGCNRFIHPGEWPHVLAILDKIDAVGVIFNLTGGRSSIPKNAKLIDRTGVTSYPEAIEALKRADGFIGVDSNFAILAAQLFPVDRLFVKCNNPYLIDHPELTYPPLDDFSFLFRRFGQPHKVRRIGPDPNGTIVELRCNASALGRTFAPYHRVELETSCASMLIAAGHAIEVTDLE